jgi:aldehyde:ferredoxin oxidoreductase
LIYAVGPLQGTKAPFGSKVVLCTKSPLTDIYLFSMASGTLGHHLARCGYKALIIVGESETPVYLWIHDGGVEFRDGVYLWGLPISETYRILEKEIGTGDFGAAMIGPAGEHLVRYAAVITELPRKRSFGRGGAGAVMGAKHLKAITISGHHDPPILDKERYIAARKAETKSTVEEEWWRKQRMRFGTTTSMPNLQEYGMLPTRNWQRGSFDRFEDIAPLVCRDQWIVEGHTCGPRCPAPCAQKYSVPQGQYAGISSEGPDYETIYAFGTNCAIDRFDAIIALEHLCDEMGLDTISTGVTLSFVMECFERGLVTPGDTGGFQMGFGDHARGLEAVRMIASRRGFGDLMAEGTRRCAIKIGQGSEAFAMHAKGLEFGGWGCRASFGQALQYALSPRGGCHHDLGLPAKVEWGTPGAAQVEGRGQLLLDCAASRIVHDSAIQCSFSGLFYGLDLLTELLESITGRTTSVSELQQVGLRVFNLERLINVREGVDRSSDRLPKRLIKEPLSDGPRKGATVPLERLKDNAYEAAGWDLATGRPTSETLQLLGLDSHVLQTFSSFIAHDASSDR